MDTHLGRPIYSVVAAAVLIAGSAAADPFYFNLQPLGYLANASGTKNVRAVSDGTMAVIVESRPTYDGWATVYDFSRPLAESRRGSLHFDFHAVPGSNAITAALDSPTAVLSGGGYPAGKGLFVMSIANPDSPSIAQSSLFTTSEDAIRVHDLEGDRLCYTDQSGTAWTLGVPFTDLATDRVPLPAVERVTEGGDFHGDQLVSTGMYIKVMDVPADASQATVSGLLPPAGQRLGQSIVVNLGDHALVSSAKDVLIIDLSNPAMPVERGRFGAESDVLGLAMMTPTLAVVTTAEGLEVVDISVPSIPAVRAAWVGAQDDLVFGGALPLPDGRILAVTQNGISMFQFTGSLQARTPSGIMTN